MWDFGELPRWKSREFTKNSAQMRGLLKAHMHEENSIQREKEKCCCPNKSQGTVLKNLRQER